MEFILKYLVHNRNEFLSIQSLERIKMPINLLWYLVIILFFLTHFKHLSVQNVETVLLPTFRQFPQILYYPN